MNFPTNHPLCGGTEASPFIKDADVVLIIDHDAPYIPDRAKPGEEARVIYMDIDPVKEHLPMWGYPADVFIHCDSSKALPELSRMIQKKLSANDKADIESRKNRLQSEHTKLRDEYRRSISARLNQKTITGEFVCACLAEAIDDKAIVLMEPMNDSSPVLRLIPRTRPGTFFQSGGASLGFGLGAALGARLARPDKTVVAVTGDGSFVFGCPTAALWAASIYHAPFLSIILNNQQYNAPKIAIRRSYGGQSYSEKTGVWVGTEIYPSPNYALIAQGCHAWGKVVEDPSELKPAMESALQQIRNGVPAVLDVRIERT
jgi:acetolactate synthase-1/2/3 large subunit